MVASTELRKTDISFSLGSHWLQRTTLHAPSICVDSLLVAVELVQFAKPSHIPPSLPVVVSWGERCEWILLRHFRTVVTNKKQSLHT